VAHTGEVIREYEQAHGLGSDGTRRKSLILVVQLDNGEEIKVTVNSLQKFSLGEEIPLYEHKGAWFIDKYGNMDKPSPVGGVVVLIVSLAALIYAKSL